MSPFLRSGVWSNKYETLSPAFNLRIDSASRGAIERTVSFEHSLQFSSIGSVSVTINSDVNKA